MRSLALLLRGAARSAAAVEPCLGSASSQLLAACGSSAGPLAPVSQLTSLWGFQLHQQAGFAAARHRGDDEDEEAVAAAAPGGRHSKLSHSERRQLIERKLYGHGEEEEEEEEEEEGAEGLAGSRSRQIHGLLQDLGRGDSDDSASQFVTSFFGGRSKGGAAAAAAGAGAAADDLRYKGEGGRYAPPSSLAAAAAGSGGEGSQGVEDSEEEEEGMSGDELESAEAEGEEGEGEEALGASLPEELDEEEEFDLMSKLQGLRPGSRRIMLAKLLEGGILQADPQALKEWQDIQTQFKPPEDFRMKVVDVNRTCKGTRTGGLYRYSCMVVVGNGNGVLGWGQGKAAEVNDAVQKAYQRACRNLYPVPRHNDHTIPEAVNSKYGQVKVTMYPKASGNGIMANSLMYEIAKMAGIHDIGIKVHGSRNVRNAVKCVFKAFDKMRTEEEIREAAAARGTMVVRMPPGRHNRLRL